MLRDTLRRPARRCGVTVAAGDVRHAPSSEVVVDHVVVHDERRVQQLECGTDVRGGLEVGTAEALVSRHDHPRPEPLAADRVLLERLPQLHVLRTEGRRTVLL